MDKICLWKKGLVIVIIVLFIGVGVYPAVAVETKPLIVNNLNEEDCGCETVNNINLDKLGILLDRLEGYTKSLLILIKQNPVIDEKCKEVSDDVNTISEKYEELSYNMDILDWDYPIICAILGVLYNSINALAYFLVDLIYYLDQFFPLFGLLAALLEFPIVFLAIIGAFVDNFGWNLDCDWAIDLRV